MSKYRKFVFICTGSDCKRSGCKTLLKDAKQLLKLDPHKGRFRLVKTKCMDFCKSGPVVVLDNEVVKRADLETLRKKLM